MSLMRLLILILYEHCLGDGNAKLPADCKPVPCKVTSQVTYCISISLLCEVIVYRLLFAVFQQLREL